jgi:undecaprenyl-diphosphatase
MEWLVSLSDAAFAALNGLTGRSWLLDALISLPVDNPLVKAGPVGAAFVYAWHSGADEAEARRRRSVLIVTVGALFLVLATSKTIGERIFLPRPFVQSQTAWHLEEGRLVESRTLPYRAPQYGDAQRRLKALERGDVAGNDLVSFPSDHAAFFFALALGIFLACRRAGTVALAWTIFAILLTRIVTGLHSPLDIVAGAGLGAAILLAAQWLAKRLGRWAVEPAAGWTLRHQALAASILFLVAFEATSVLENVRGLAGTGAEIAEAVSGTA